MSPNRHGHRCRHLTGAAGDRPSLAVDHAEPFALSLTDPAMRADNARRIMPEEALPQSGNNQLTG